MMKVEILYLNKLKLLVQQVKTKILTTPPDVSIEDVYPVGSIYMNADTSENPTTLLGFGTWSQTIQGRSPMSSGTGYAIGATGGSATHTLTTAEMASHTHSYPYQVNSGWARETGGTHPYRFTGANTGYKGGGGAHNNMPPYQAIYIWRRDA